MTETLRSGLRSDDTLSPTLKVKVQAPALPLPSGGYSYFPTQSSLDFDVADRRGELRSGKRF